MTKGVQSQMQATTKRFLPKIKGYDVLQKFVKLQFENLLNIKWLLLQIERSQRRRFGHVSRMPEERLNFAC